MITGTLPPGFDVYSIALLTAMILAGAAFVITVTHAITGGRQLLAAAGKLCLVALAFAVFALFFHFKVGHPEGSAAALTPVAFLDAHRAMAIVVLLTAGLAVAAGRAAGR